ncbi:MAG: hypothetical protein LBQ60_16045 [Bacteroidales bacterium]|jgi:hypothetical protein|nr:hypothetical protein [Bacteroidales bacterium]
MNIRRTLIGRIALDKALLTIFLFISSYSFAQTSQRWNEIRIDGGINQIKEKNIHPKTHDGFMVGVNYGHGNMKRNIYSIETGLSFSMMKTTYESSLASANVRFFFDYHYLFPVNGNRTFSYFLGPEIGLNYSVSYYPNWDESHLYWANYLGTGFRNELVCQVHPRHQLILDLSIPVLFVLSRPDADRKYKMDDFSPGKIMTKIHEQPEVSFWNRSFVMEFTLEHQIKGINRVIPAFYYSFNYYRLQTKDSRSFKNVSHQLGVKFYL